MGSGNRYSPLLDDFKRALAANESFSREEQIRSCDSFIRNLEEQAENNERTMSGDMSERVVLRNLEGAFNHYPRAMAKAMFLEKIVAGINSGEDFIECLRLLQQKLGPLPRVSSLIDKMTKNNRHLETLKGRVESY